MRQENYCYRIVEIFFYEVMRIIKGTLSDWSSLKEGNALIDPERTGDNYEIVPHHIALNPAIVEKEELGKAIAAYHKEVTGRSARMNGPEKQLSKAVGVIISLPKTYLTMDYGLTEEEYAAIAHKVESNGKKEPKSSYYMSAMKKIQGYRYTAEEKKAIREFFEAAFESWLNVAGVRREDVLYAVVHMDETFPHLHIMALPTYVKENGEITFSTAKYNNLVTHYYDNLHTNMIREMSRYGIDASGLLNGNTKGKGFRPADFSREQREEGVRRALENLMLKLKNEKILQATETAEMNLMTMENACQVLAEMLERDEMQVLDAEKCKTGLMEEIHSLMEEKEAKMSALVMLEGEITLGQKELSEITKKQFETTGITEKEMKRHKKELQRVQKTGDRPNITQYEYERLMDSSMTREKIEKQREELEADRRNFEQTVAERARAMFPEELKQAKKDKEYCDFWLPKAETLDACENELARRMDLLIEREKEVSCREQALEEVVEVRAQTLFREMKEMFFRTVIDAIIRLKDAITNVLGHILAFEIRERVNEAINQEIDWFVENLDGMYRENDDRTEEISPEEWDITGDE